MENMSIISGENVDNKYSIHGLGNYVLAFFDKLIRGIPGGKNDLLFGTSL